MADWAVCITIYVIQESINKRLLFTAMGHLLRKNITVAPEGIPAFKKATELESE